MRVPPTKNVVIRVPRFGTIPPAPEVIETAKKIVERQGGIFRPEETIDPHGTEGEGLEPTSEWNSMLLTARAQRGPQWDVSLQSFQVDKQSHLYYDHGVLTAAAEGEDVVDANSPNVQSQGQTPSASGFASPPPSARRTPGGDYMPNGAYGTHPATPSPAPSRMEMPPPSTERRRLTRHSSGRDMF